MALDEGKVLRAVLTELAREGQRYVPVGVSMRHVHLSEQDLAKLFGTGYTLHSLRELSQPGQFAAKEQVTLVGPKGTLEKVRIIGPTRKETQVELSLTDAMSIGLKNLPVRLSGKLEQTPGIRILGPSGEVVTAQGTIVAARHVHFSREQARAYGVLDGQVISLRAEGERPFVYGNVICRVGDGHELEFHIDTDEANASLLKNGDLLEFAAEGHEAPEEEHRAVDQERLVRRVVNTLTGRAQDPEDYRIRAGHKEQAADQIFELITETEVNLAAKQGQQVLYCAVKGLVTPAAADRAEEKDIRIVRAAVKESARNEKENRVLEAGAELLTLVTAQDLNTAFRDNQTALYCTKDALVTPAARERIAETGIQIIRI